MNDDHEKLFFQQIMNQNAIVRAEQAIEREGKVLPCTVTATSADDTMVTVKLEVESDVYVFPEITIPKHQSPYFIEPTVVGDQGVVFPADVYTGNITGYGGSSTLRKQPNLSNLHFVPISNMTKPSPHPGYAVQRGPSGFVCETMDGTCSITGNANGITIAVGGKTWTFTASGFTDSNGIVEETHLHGGVQTGSGDTGAPIAG